MGAVLLILIKKKRLFAISSLFVVIFLQVKYVYLALFYISYIFNASFFCSKCIMYSPLYSWRFFGKSAALCGCLILLLVDARVTTSNKDEFAGLPDMGFVLISIFKF
jgi:hypothetical protein